MQKSIIVLGIGRFGYAVATKLFQEGAYVTAVDSDYEKIERIADSVSSAIQADITDNKSMKTLGLNNYDVAIIGTASNTEASIVAALICKDNGVERVIAKASSSTHARILLKIGADQIVFPEIDTAEFLSRSIISSHVLDYLELSEEYSITEIKAHESWFNKSIQDLDFRNEYELNIIAIKRHGKIILNFDSNFIIHENDILVIIGNNEQISKVDNLY